jgi:Dehydrogenases with different specificities (related to short-chain alcohol dehydrogenases)
VAYAAAKFGLERWMQSPQAEVAAFSIHRQTTVNPDFFRTKLFAEESKNFAPASIDDYN